LPQLFSLTSVLRRASKSSFFSQIVQAIFEHMKLTIFFSVTSLVFLVFLRASAVKLVFDFLRVFVPPWWVLLSSPRLKV
jgi:hypothetical protein